MINIKQVLGGLGTAATVGLISSSASAVLIFEDDFNRADSYTVGNGWTEIEDDSNDVRIKNNKLRLRDNQPGIDAAVIQLNLDATGLSDIYLDFDWAANSATESEPEHYTDWLYAGIKVGNSGWEKVWSTDLGGSDFASVSVGAILSAANASSFKLSFWTDVTASNEYALIDNVRLYGSTDDGHGGPVASVPEPGALALLGFGLAALGFSRKSASA